MTHRFDALLLWSPRILGILVCLFLSLFALDAFAEGKTLGQELRDLSMHVAPVLLLAVVVGLSWRRPRLGGFVFTGLAIAYAYVAHDHASWIAVVAGPLLIVGILFSWSGVRNRELRTGV